MSKYVQALAVSDTHGNHRALEAIVRDFSNIAYVFHLGDYVRDAEYLSEHMLNSAVVNVKGNCDVGSNDPLYEELIIKDQRLILTHGHTLNVKYGYDRALYYAEEHKANAILFGHTHIPEVERASGIWLVNPGSAGEARNGRPTVAILLIGEEGIVPKILPLQI